MELVDYALYTQLVAHRRIIYIHEIYTSQHKKFLFDAKMLDKSYGETFRREITILNRHSTILLLYAYIEGFFREEREVLLKQKYTANFKIIETINELSKILSISNEKFDNYLVLLDELRLIRNSIVHNNGYLNKPSIKIYEKYGNDISMSNGNINPSHIFMTKIIQRSLKFFDIYVAALVSYAMSDNKNI